MSTSFIRDDKAVLSISDNEVAEARTFISDVEQANGSRPTAGSAGITVALETGASVEMPAGLTALISQVLDLVARGCTVTVGSVPNEVTTTVAARMLDISRPTLVKLIREGRIPAHKVGSHTRLKTADVLSHRDSQRAEQRAAFDDLRAFEDDLHLPES
ncbi:helix-turn-helix domain-containing protein [Nocardia caishijiensis]|uniref:Excisionase family DNA binding protein n=1 Tax=Nocardia caishijiensis TaxID=184756 RepID=A0ABQ6YSA2_9NOCA|nr:helix-turn-helix domain-containing protein [Nocardia caishijiensis]KAF0848649.1 excisionase family DNA binding protein [Nocardia caishijiensis]